MLKCLKTVVVEDAMIDAVVVEDVMAENDVMIAVEEEDVMIEKMLLLETEVIDVKAKVVLNQGVQILVILEVLDLDVQEDKLFC